MPKVNQAAGKLEIRKSDVLLHGVQRKLHAVIRRRQRVQWIGLQRLPTLHEP
jgi:hypothetical protein